MIRGSVGIADHLTMKYLFLGVCGTSTWLSDVGSDD